jgi:RNA polymerase sigma-70 factor (ECF subfamily)
MRPDETLFQPAKPKPDKRMDKSRPAGRKAELRLAAQAQAGDPAAMRRLLEELSGPIYKFGRRFCRNEQDAQDVMQESLAALVRTLPRWRGDSALSTWAYSVARNTCGRMRRRRAGAPQRLESLEDEATNAAVLKVAAPGPDPAREFERNALRRALDAALAALPAAQREVVVLRDVEGLSTREVAATLGLAEEAVKSRLHRGRLALRRALAAERGEDVPARHPGCPDTARMLSLHLEGELDAATCRRLSAHVEKCPDCKHACTTLRRTLTACARLGGAAVPAATRASIRRAIKAVIEADRSQD